MKSIIINGWMRVNGALSNNVDIEIRFDELSDNE